MCQSVIYPGFCYLIYLISNTDIYTCILDLITLLIKLRLWYMLRFLFLIQSFATVFWTWISIALWFFLLLLYNLVSVWCIEKNFNPYIFCEDHHILVYENTCTVFCKISSEVFTWLYLQLLHRFLPEHTLSLECDRRTESSIDLSITLQSLISFSVSSIKGRLRSVRLVCIQKMKYEIGTLSSRHFLFFT